jgi:chaperonin GroES
MDLTPTDDRILVEHLPPAVFPQGNGIILLPNRDPGEPDYARVVAVGPGRLTDNGTLMLPGVAVGDLVLVYPKAGHPITFKGTQYWFIQPGNILGRVTGVVGLEDTA